MERSADNRIGEWTATPYATNGPMASARAMSRTDSALPRMAATWSQIALNRAITELRAQGHSLRRIAFTLNERGQRTRRGTSWKLESVSAA